MTRHTEPKYRKGKQEAEDRLDELYREMFLIRLIGASETVATEAIKMSHYTPRVTFRDGTAYIVTRDRDLNRVNLTIEHGLVTAAKYG